MKIIVIGLGYVGCPLAYQLAKHFTVVGLDICADRIESLKRGIDETGELDDFELSTATWQLTTDSSRIQQADIIIVTVPTPIDESNNPDLSPLTSASLMISKHMKRGAIVVYESTVWPGLTEEHCIPLLESGGLSYSAGDFNVGYSPERINPGDKVNTLTAVTKIVSGDCARTLDIVDSIYSKITHTYKAKSIKVAEAAKVMENIQRDVNIALMNELSNVLTKLGIDTHDVLNAAGSKWNFLKFEPGFVGGHCIGVDPYYMINKASKAGYVTNLMLSARKINESMPYAMVRRIADVWRAGPSKTLSKARVLVMGCTFKEDVPDIRNSKVFDLIEGLVDLGATVDVVDPKASPEMVEQEYQTIIMTSLSDLSPNSYDIVVLAVPHKQYIHHGWHIIDRYLSNTAGSIVLDLKARLERDITPDNVILLRP